MYKTEKFR